MKDLKTLQQEIQLWSDTQFGNDRSPLPMLFHLKKEIDELIEAMQRVVGKQFESRDLALKSVYDVKNEFADCFMLLLDSASHFGIDSDMLIKLTDDKLQVNKNRKWGKPDKNGVVEHV